MNMGAFGENFPYTNFHDLNLDWIIKVIKEIKVQMENVLERAVKMADPPEWDSNTAYEEYTIVFDTDGVYLSKKYVPIGIPTSNTEYWEKLVDLTALYELVQSASDDADSALAAAQAALSAATAAQTTASGAQTAAQAAQTAAQAAQTTANQAVTNADTAWHYADSVNNTATSALSTATSAQTAASTAQTTANSAQTAASNAQNTANSAAATGAANTQAINALDRSTVKNNSVKNVLYVGDSYSTWYSRALPNSIRTKLGIPSAQFHDVSVSGSGFTGAGSESFLNIITSYSGNKNEITDIIFVGGINDALIEFNQYTDSYPDVSALTNAISAVAAYITSNYPNAKVHTAYVGGTLPTSSLYASAHPSKSQEWALWGWTINAQSKGWNVLQTWNAIHQSPDNYNADGIHPSEAYGIPAIADAVATSFNKEYMPINRPVRIYNINSSMIDTTTVDSSAQSLSMGIKDNMVHISFPTGYFVIKQGTVVGSNRIRLAFLTEFAQIRGSISTVVTLGYRGFNNDTHAHVSNGILTLEDNALYIQLYVVNSAGTGYQDFTAQAPDFTALTFLGVSEITLPLYMIN